MTSRASVTSETSVISLLSVASVTSVRCFRRRLISRTDAVTSPRRVSPPKIPTARTSGTHAAEEPLPQFNDAPEESP
jgi:hypothetical protein